MRKNISHILYLLMPAVLAASCSQDEFNDGQSDILPEGKYPLELNAYLTAAPSARATVDGTWEGGETVTVQVEDTEDGNAGTYEYTASAEGMLTSVNPYYWEDVGLPVRVSAWHYGSNQYRTSTGSWIVRSNQNTNSGFQASDFIYAPPVEMTFRGQNARSNPALTFYHQTAKVTVHIRNTEVAANATLNGMTIDNTITGGGWYAPEDGTQGRWGTLPRDPESITPLSLGAQEFTNSGSTETSAASYTAIVIPQTIAAGKVLFTINVDGYAPFGYTVPSGGITWQAGMHYTYIITVKGSNLELWIKTSGWDAEEGNTGNGSVEIV